MKNNLISTVLRNLATGKQCLSLLAILVLASVVVGILTGCETQSAKTKALVQRAGSPPDSIELREGDELKITFPGSPTLDTTEQIRRDGKITLPLVGDVAAADMTPSMLQSNLLVLFGPQLVTKEVTVELVNSSYPVFVTGMVLRPGKIMSNHPMSALEAVMECGGFDYTKANLRGVKVIRREGDVMKSYTLNLKVALEGKQSEPFYLQPGDIIYVPERFTMF